MTALGRKTHISGDMLRILHLSDLHFSYHADEGATNSIHCPHLAEALSKLLPTLRFDIVVVSGDLTDCGDKESLLRARSYLFSEYNVSGSKQIGLKLIPDRVRIIPGNHDAFNMPRIGSPFDRVQKALENYAAVFPDCFGSSDRCGYEWIECDGWDAYFAFADSCFLGDPDLEQTRPVLPYLETTAKGKLARSQASKLLAWSDRGRNGRLDFQFNGSAIRIPAERFKSSLKVLVMHHYLFEPKNCNSEWMMRFIDRHDVFHNIALCDFDMLWCGHRHIPDFCPHTYGYHMQDRGKNRYLFNFLRHSLGMASMPMPDALPESGKQIPRIGRFLLNALVSRLKKSAGGIRQETDNALALIGLALQDKTRFRHRMKEIISTAREQDASWSNMDECEQLLQQIESTLNKVEQQALWTVLDDTGRRIIKAFAQRPFVQVLSGSAIKKSSPTDRPRGFYLHEIKCVGKTFQAGAGIYVEPELTRFSTWTVAFPPICSRPIRELTPDYK